LEAPATYFKTIAAQRHLPPEDVEHLPAARPGAVVGLERVDAGAV